MIRLLGSVIVAVFLFAAAGCGTDEGYTDIVVPSGFVRTVNAIPDSPGLIIEIGNSSAQQLGYTQSTGFVTALPDLALDVDVTYIGGNARQPLLSGQTFVGVDNEVTLILAGTMDAPQLLEIEEVPPTDIDITTQLLLRFAHVAALSDEAVQVNLLQGGETVQQFTLAFGQTSDLLTLNAGDYRLQAVDPATNAVLWDSGDFSLSGGTRGLVVLTDYFGPGDTDVRMLSITDDGTVPFQNEILPTAVRLVNLAAEQGPLSATVNDESIAENVVFQSTSDYTVVTSGTSSVTITPFGDPATVLYQASSATLPAGTFLTLAAVDADSGTTAEFFFDERRRVPTRGVLSITNGAPAASSIDIYLVDPGVDIADRAPRLRLPPIPEAGASQTLDLEPGSYDFVVTEATTKNILLGPTRIDIAGGGIYSVRTSEKLGGGTPIELVLGDDF